MISDVRTSNLKFMQSQAFIKTGSDVKKNIIQPDSVLLPEVNIEENLFFTALSPGGQHTQHRLVNLFSCFSFPYRFSLIGGFINISLSILSAAGAVKPSDNLPLSRHCFRGSR